jgi:hypothetical protein
MPGPTTASYICPGLQGSIHWFPSKIHGHDGQLLLSLALPFKRKGEQPVLDGELDWETVFSPFPHFPLLRDSRRHAAKRPGDYPGAAQFANGAPATTKNALDEVGVLYFVHAGAIIVADSSYATLGHSSYKVFPLPQ